MFGLKEFYSGKRIFLTGHTGFKGSWLTQILVEWGAIVKGFSLGVQGKNSHFELLSLGSKIGDVFSRDS